MEYRNAGAATHFGKGLVVGVDSSNAGVEIAGSTIISASDSAASGIALVAKGTGTVSIGNSSNTVLMAGSTTPLKFIAGESTVTPPDLAAEAGGNCTITISGASTGDIVLAVDFRNTLSTGYLVTGNAFFDAANHMTIPIHNASGSTISNSTGVTVRWLYLDRT